MNRRGNLDDLKNSSETLGVGMRVFRARWADDAWLNKNTGMRIPVIRGVIDRRILANFHIAPDQMARVLPAPFRPKLKNGCAVGGICLIRLKDIRPRLIPLPWGLRSENAAHRIAVEWDVDGQLQEGVYIPRRDISSRINTWAGGTIFPGTHHHATFTVNESEDHFSVSRQRL